MYAVAVVWLMLRLVKAQLIVTGTLENKKKLRKKQQCQQMCFCEDADKEYKYAEEDKVQLVANGIT